MDEIFLGLAASAAASALYEALQGRMRARRAVGSTSTGIRVELPSGESISDGVESGLDDNRETVVVESSTDVTVKDVLRIIEASKRSAAPKETWWLRHGGTVLVGTLTFVGTIFGLVWTTVTDEDPAPPCIEYASELSELRLNFPNATSEALFGDGGLSFGEVEEACGNPSTIFDALG